MQPEARTTLSGPRISRVHVGLGSNLDPETHILQAIPEIAARMKVLASSRFYRTPAFPASQSPQPLFINGVLQVEVPVGPWELKFGVLREIESKIGRIRTQDPCAPRKLDLDLLLFDGVKIDSDLLTLPDPDIFVRSFWAIPLADLVPDLPIPGTSLALHQVASQMQCRDVVYLEPLTRKVRSLLRQSHDA